MVPILDIPGHCPACRNPSLHRMPGGLIRCLHAGCPEPGAVNLLLRLDEQLHFMKVDGDGAWIVKHPLIERIHPGNLFSCEIGPKGEMEPGFYGLNTGGNNTFQLEEGTWYALKEDPWPSPSG